MPYMLEIQSASGEWHDYTRYIKLKGFGWKRNDLHSEKTVRVKTGKMRIDKIGTKRTCSYEVMPTATQEVLIQMDDDLSQDSFNARYSDLHGKKTAEFYCSSFEATLAEVEDDGTEIWEGQSFTMIEV